MKNRIVFFVILLCWMSGFSNEEIKISGKIKKSSTKKVWIYNQDLSISDTVSLSFFGKFSYSKTISGSQLLFISPLGSDRKVVLSVSPGDQVKLKTKLPDLLSNLKLSGNSGTQDAGDFISIMSGIQREIELNEEKLYKDETADGQYYYDSVIGSLGKLRKREVQRFITDNKNNPVLIKAAEYVDYDSDYEELLAIERGIRKEYSASPTYKKVKSALNKFEMSKFTINEVGQKVPALILPGINNEDLSTQDLEGKYLLIDFWASWCSPCRAEHPRLVRLFNEYHSQGLEIYSISLDKDKERWLKAIEKDKLIWKYHVSNLQMFESPAVDMFDVKALPFNVLVDRNGKVIAFDLRGQQLENKLKELFKDE